MRKKIKCPMCEGPPNNMFFSHIEKSPDKKREFAVFVIECWSGDLTKKSIYHFFKARVKLPKTVEIDQIKIQEEEIEKLQTQIEELEDEIETLQN